MYLVAMESGVLDRGQRDLLSAIELYFLPHTLCHAVHGQYSN